MASDTYIKGRGAQLRPENPFRKSHVVRDHIEGLDNPDFENPELKVFYETPKKILSRYNSPDLGGEGYSLNPYQGCEHGCTYCYARNSHQYWGFDAGIDFESKIVVKKDAPILLEKVFLSASWKPRTIMISGNTDCYQPIERKMKITRKILQIFAKYRNPASMITKNSLIARDIDILQDMARDNLVRVFISINSYDEGLRRRMEPRTASVAKRFGTIEKLANAGVPAGVMIAPVIPGLNDHDLPTIIKKAREHGAVACGYEVVRLNGNIDKIFKDWLVKNYPDRAHKVWSQIESLHGGKVNDSEWHRRLTGEGNFSSMIAGLFHTFKKRHFQNQSLPPLDKSKFRKGGNFRLF